MFKWLKWFIPHRPPIDRLLRGIKGNQFKITLNNGSCDRYSLIVNRNIELYRYVRDRGEVLIQLNECDHIASRPRHMVYSSDTDGWMTPAEVELVFKTAKEVYTKTKIARERNEEGILQSVRNLVNTARHKQVQATLEEMDRMEE